MAVNDENLWPYLSSMFEFTLRAGNSLKFKCLLCLPKKTVISAYMTSPSNLRKHVEVCKIKCSSAASMRVPSPSPSGMAVYVVN